ncbi:MULTISPECIES: PP2C family serine/threonine-protein phosphatase [unclassified Pseudofrankia]|uniref:PP2C family protein-serine/threonine phosphatase n=1 Tax=unclassified Pseudofrankia TaxID=2994372 RepID=UPI0008DA5EFE|nr:MULTISPECIES: PP2C family serine/threonine-protein phosphatase [unclassified Pseudofrankia]MDT3443522.1 serine/threonine-protein phosphatase [Pseudofrankia sp. BMG5.37]OHV42727.1 serine/threonine protein phosphatase [Pseudofrankia sp. BMG5.36]
MKSSLLPIMLIVVLVVGATVFVVLSSRSGRTHYGPGGLRPPTVEPGRDDRPRGRRAGRSRDHPGGRGGASGTRRSAAGDGYSSDAANLVPGFGPAAPADGRAGARASAAEGKPAAAGGPAGPADPAGPGPAPDLDARRVDHAWSDDVTTQVPTGDGGWPDDDRDPEATGWAPPPSGPPHPGAAQAGPAGGGSAPGRDVVDTTWAADEAAWTVQPSASQLPVPEPPRQQPAPDAPTVPSAGPPAPAAASPVPPAPAPPGAPPAVPVTTPGPYVADEPEHFSAPPLRLSAAGRTRRGKRGGPNEDAFVVVDGLLAVSDGVGGEAAGQIASTLAVTTVAGFRPQYAADPREGLRAAVERANRVVRERPKSEPSWRGMACTLDVVVLGRQETTGRTLTVAHVGDSTVWLQPGRGEPRQLTTPHAITGGPLLNAIGLADEVEMDLFQVEVQAGDRVVLSSDGMTKVMKPEQLYGLLHQLASDPPERAADALVEAALLAGARDDTTVVVADLVPEPTPR